MASKILYGRARIIAFIDGKRNISQIMRAVNLCFTSGNPILKKFAQERICTIHRKKNSMIAVLTPKGEKIRDAICMIMKEGF